MVDPAGTVNPGVGGTTVMVAREDGKVGLRRLRGGQLFGRVDSNLDSKLKGGVSIIY